MKNTFWAVYSKKGEVVTVSPSENGAKREALRQSTYRWTLDNFDKMWDYLVADGHKIIKSEIKPLTKTK